jgi:hypothetical protein
MREDTSRIYIRTPGATTAQVLGVIKYAGGVKITVLEKQKMQMTRRRVSDQESWEELIYLISLHKFTENNIQCHHLHAKFHPNTPIGKSCTLLRSLNVHHFTIIEVTALNIMESKPSSMSSPPYKISPKSANRLRSY